MRIAIQAPSDAGCDEDVYNRRMVEALRRAGHDAAVIAPESEAPDGGWIVAADARAAGLGGARAALVHNPVEAMREGLARADVVIAAGEATAARLRAEFGVEPARIRVVPPGADHGARSTGSRSACRLLSVGAITPRRGYDVLLRALARLGDLDWRLTIAGAPADPSCADGLHALARDSALAPLVTFSGAAGDDAMEALWSQADVFALASSWEPHGTAAANALARGVPVFATGPSAAGVAVPLDAGALCDDGAALSKALRRAIFDAELRAALREGAWRAGQALPGWDARAQAFATALGPG